MEMTNEQFLYQLGVDLSQFRPSITWIQEPAFYKGVAGTAFHAWYRGRNCGWVVTTGRCLSVQMGADAVPTFEYLRTEGYEVMEAFNNMEKVR